MPNRIVIDAPERLLKIIREETQANRREALATSLLRLLELHACYITGNTDPMPTDTELAQRPERVGTIWPCHSAHEAEFAWGIVEAPDHRGHGTRVLNGGLIRHSDNTWGIHT